jgi:long-chain acyl-CoA synthetase
VSLEAPDHPGRVIARLARHVEVALATVELTLPQYRVLIHLCEGREAASGLADKLAVSRPSVTGVVDGLVARELVRRDHDSDDRRRVGHELTDAGRRVLAAADAEVKRRMEEIAAHAPAGDPLEGLEVWRDALAAYRAACHAARTETTAAAEAAGGAAETAAARQASQGAAR